MKRLVVVLQNTDAQDRPIGYPVKLVGPFPSYDAINVWREAHPQEVGMYHIAVLDLVSASPIEEFTGAFARGAALVCGLTSWPHVTAVRVRDEKVIAVRYDEDNWQGVH